MRSMFGVVLVGGSTWVCISLHSRIENQQAICSRKLEVDVKSYPLKSKALIKDLRHSGFSIKSVWVSSHTNIEFNDKADMLARAIPTKG